MPEILKQPSRIDTFLTLPAQRIGPGGEEPRRGLSLNLNCTEKGSFQRFHTDKKLDA